MPVTSNTRNTRRLILKLWFGDSERVRHESHNNVHKSLFKYQVFSRNWTLNYIAKKINARHRILSLQWSENDKWNNSWSCQPLWLTQCNLPTICYNVQQSKTHLNRQFLQTSELLKENQLTVSQGTLVPHTTLCWLTFYHIGKTHSACTTCFAIFLKRPRQCN